MRLISCERIVNIDTFEPELVLTLAVGIETIFDNIMLFLIQMKLLKSWENSLLNYVIKL